MTLPSTTIIDLPYEDILIDHLLPLLEIDDLFNLRLVSNLFNEITNQYMRRLKILNLSRSKWLTNGQLKYILYMNHDRIKQLDLSYNLSLNNQLLTRYLITYRLNQMNTIKLNDCHWIDRRSFSLLILNYGLQLKNIECGGCWCFDDHIISLMAICCPNLKRLNLSKLYLITDLSLIKLAQHQKQNLKSLNLLDCWKVTSFGIYFLIRCTTHLDVIEIDQVHLNSINKLLMISDEKINDVKKVFL